VILFQFIKIHPLETSYTKQVDLFPTAIRQTVVQLIFLFNHTKKKIYNKGKKIVSGLFSYNAKIKQNGLLTFLLPEHILNLHRHNTLIWSW
jgi:hypothetical protein